MAKRVNSTVGFPDHLEQLEIELPDGEPPPWDAHSKLSVVGRARPRLDALAKVTGSAKYTWDLKLPGMLFARVLRSPHPAARLSAIDAGRARALPGVRAVWTEQPGKRILFAGQEVAAVAAVSLAIAEEALRLVAVEYSKLPWVVETDRARQPGAPLVFEPRGDDHPPAPRRPARGATVEQNGNVRTVSSVEPAGADVDKALGEAAVTVEGTFRTQVQTHSALETHGTLARWQGGELTLWTSTQATFAVRDQVAEALRLAHDQVHVICEFMGGGFGAKFNAGHWSVLAARLARDAGAPVKLMLTRHEEHLCTGNRPDSVQLLRLGARRDGTLLALHLTSYGTPGVGTGAGTAGPAHSLYRVKAARFEEADVFTNTGAAAPFRAPGHPQGCFALEQSIDELAERLGMDPIALRKKNLKNPVQIAQLDAVSRMDVWRRKNRKPGEGRGPKKRGVGLACGLWYKIVNPSTQIQIDAHRDGRVEVLSGAQDIGTGTRTIMAMVAAEELGLPVESITVRIGDTRWPIGPGSGGSCTTPSIAPAVRTAAVQLKRKLLDLNGGRTLDWKQACARIGGDKLSVLADRAPEYEAYQEQVGGVQLAEVEVDVETGAVRVLKVTAIQDCGRVLDPLLAESQVNGGIIQGVSYALLENRQMDRSTGRMVNADLEQYKIATANDCPEIEVHLFEVWNAGNGAAVTGLGEPPTVPTAAAIANAVYNATGARMRELPMTPDRVLAALRVGGGGGGGR
jgi:xanthine dehydrogenase YagR molybdenum-binding subunit